MVWLSEVAEVRTPVLKIVATAILNPVRQVANCHVILMLIAEYR